MKKTLLGGALALAASAAMWPVLSNGLGTRPVADRALTARDRAVTIDVLANDGLTGLQAMRILYPPTHGSAQVVGDRIVYTPAPGFTGRDRFHYTAKAGRSFGKAAVDIDVGEALVLRGKVTDGPIANAQVSASLGGHVFRAQADAGGDYVLEVIGLGDGMLTMAAQGTGPQASVNFRSVVGGFARLRAEAGADCVLERSENNQVQVTNVSTAQAVLMQAANGGAPVTDEAALQVARESLDQSRLLQAAAVIKLVVDGGYSLPAGVPDTLALVSDEDAYAGFVDAVNADDPGAIQSAILQIVNDVNLIVPTTQAELVGAYALIDDLGRPGTVAVGLIQGARLELAADGTGVYVGALPTATGGVTWTYANGKATVTPVSPVTSVSYETIEGIGQVRRLYTERELQVTRLADGDGRDTLAVQQVVDYSYPDNPELPGGTTTSAGTKLGIRDGAGRHAWTAADLVGQHSLPTAGTPYANSNNTGSEIHAIAADGTGFVGTSDLGFTWALAGGVLQVAYADGSASVFERVTRDARGGEGVTARWMAPDGRRNAVFSLASVRTPGLFFTTANAVGPWRSGFYISRTSNPAASDFYVIANAGGTGVQVGVEPWGTVTTALGWNIGLGALRWTYYRNGANQPVTFCEVGVDGCYIWQIRQWRPMARDGDRVYLIEEFLVDFTGNGAFEIVTQRANWYELAPPPPYRLSLPSVARAGATPGRR